MSAECWIEASDQTIRLPGCSHVINLQELPKGSRLDMQCGFSCPVCDEFQPQIQDMLLALRDGVPSSSEKWGTGGCNARRDLVDGRNGKGFVKDVGALLARMSSPSATHITMPARDLFLAPHDHICSPRHLVLRAAPTGCTVKGGTITLLNATVLMLGGRGACFRGVSFVGGVLVCTGAGHSTSFQGCHFHTVAVYAVHGAAVTLRDCSHNACPPIAVASGAGSSVSMRGCWSVNCWSAVVAEHGGTAAVADCALYCCNGVIVRGASSAVSCADSQFHGPPPGQGFALAVNGGRAVLRRCAFEAFYDGLQVTGRGAVEAHHCRVQVQDLVLDMAGAQHAHAVLRECELVSRPAEEQGPGHSAVTLYGEPPHAKSLQMERCDLLVHGWDVMGLGVRSSRVAMRLSSVHCRGRAGAVNVMRAPARAVLAHCDIRNSVGPGCVVQGAGCAARVVGGAVTAESSACMNDGGTLAVHGARVGPRSLSNRSMVAMAAPAVNSSMGTTALCRTTIEHARIAVGLDGGSLCMRDCHAIGPGWDAWGQPEDSEQRSAGCSGRWGDLSVVGGSIRGFRAGVEIMQKANADRPVGREPAPFVLDFDGMCFDGNGWSISVTAVATVSCVGCTFNASDGAALAVPAPADIEFTEAAVALRKVRKVSFCDCSFSGHLQHLRCDSAGAVEIRGCSFVGRQEAGAGVGVVLDEKGLLEGCTFRWLQRGVYLQSHACAIRRCHFHECEVAVVACKRSSVEVVECEADRCGSCIAARERSAVLVQDCSCTYTFTGVLACIGASVKVLRTSLAGHPEGAMLSSVRVGGYVDPQDAVDGRQAVVLLEDCSLGGQMCVDSGAEATLRKCTLSSVASGICVSAGAVVRAFDSEIFAREACVEVAKASVRECVRCHRSGLIALAAGVWGAARNPPQGVAEGALCEHEGAVAEVVLEGVQLRGGATGLWVSDAGVVVAKRVHAVDCETAFDVVRSGRRTREFQECTVSGGGERPVRVRQRRGPEADFRLEERWEAVAGIAVMPGAPTANDCDALASVT